MELTAGKTDNSNDNVKSINSPDSVGNESTSSHDAYSRRILCCWAFTCDIKCIKSCCFRIGDIDFVAHGYYKRIAHIRSLNLDYKDEKEWVSGLIDSVKGFWELIGVIAALLAGLAIDTSLNDVQYAADSLLTNLDEWYLESEDIIEWVYTIYAVSINFGAFWSLLCVFFCAFYYAILTSVINDLNDIEDFLKYFPTWLPLALIAQALFWIANALCLIWILIHPWKVMLICSIVMFAIIMASVWLMVFWARMSREINLRSSHTPEAAANRLFCCPCRGSVAHIK